MSAPVDLVDVQKKPEEDPDRAGAPHPEHAPIVAGRDQVLGTPAFVLYLG